MIYNTPTEEELTYLKSITDKKRYGRDEINQMYKVFNRIFSANRRPTSCSNCLSDVHKSLMKVLELENNKPQPKPKRGRPKKQQ